MSFLWRQAELLIADSPFKNGMKLIRIRCAKCHCYSKAANTGKPLYSKRKTKITTPNTKQKGKKAVMGFKADTDSMKRWKLYAEATGQEIGIMCSKAINEYIKNHPLTKEQKQFLELKQKNKHLISYMANRLTN